jgi:hypothetical protein
MLDITLALKLGTVEGGRSLALLQEDIRMSAMSILYSILSIHTGVEQIPDTSGQFDVKTKLVNAPNDTNAMGSLG